MQTNQLDTLALIDQLTTTGKTSTLVIVEELLRRKYEIQTPYWPRPIIMFRTEEGQERTIMGVVCQKTPALPRVFSGDKYVMYRLAEQLDLPVLDYELYVDADSARQFWITREGHCILKSAKGEGGKGVRVSFSGTEDFLRTAQLMSEDQLVLMQRRSPALSDIRLLFIGGRYVAATVRRPMVIRGNGVLSLRQHVHLENLRRDQLNVTHHPTMRLKHLNLQRAEQISGLTSEAVIARGQEVYVSLANIASGGIAQDVTHELHEGFRKLSKVLVEELCSPVVAVDYLSIDHRKDPLDPSNETTFLETNLRPGIDLHQYPHSGQGVNVSALYVDYVIAECSR